MTQRAWLRWIGLLLAAVLLLQVFFLLRIALMVWIAPESTSFERSQAWAIATHQDRLRWRQQ